jgi:predicted Ser/Thr protein kinase
LDLRRIRFCRSSPERKSHGLRYNFCVQSDQNLLFVRLTRRDVEQFRTRTIHSGRGYQSSVYLVEKNGQRAAVKDFSRVENAAFRRFVAPLLIAREAKALRALNDTPGVPKYFGKVDRLAFAMEFIEGTPVADFAEGELDPIVFPRVQEVIDAVHARGVSHGDLKRRSNLLVTPDKQIYLIDFAAATVGRRRFNPFVNWLQKSMAEIDDKSLPRIKKFAAPDLMTEDDWHKLNNKTPLEQWARKLLNR